MAAREKHPARTTREKLLEAAGRLFLEKGFDGVSIRDITEAAGANVASINYHFQGKENLYREVFRRMLKKMSSSTLEELARVVGEKTPPDIEKAIRTYVSGFLGEFITSRDAQNFLRLASQEMSEDGIATDILLSEAAEPAHKLLKEAVRSARPGLSDAGAALVVGSIAGQVLHFIRAKHVIQSLHGRQYDKDFINEIQEHIIGFSLKGMGL